MQGWGNSDLTTAGHEQARRHGELLNRERVSKIHASDLGRVRQTVERIHESCNVETHFDEELRECNLGAWEGLQHADIQARWQREYDAWHEDRESIPAPNGEAFNDVKRRVATRLRSIPSKAGDRIALVTHSGTTRVLLDLLVELSDEQKLALRISNNVVHMVEKRNDKTSVFHFRDGGDPVEGICTSWT